MLYISDDIYLGTEEELKYSKQGISRNIYSYWYILSSLHFLRVTDSKYKDIENPYIQLSAKMLKQTIGRYRNYIDFLIKKGIIETDNWYIVGKKCKGYRLTKKYKNAKFRLFKGLTGIKSVDYPEINEFEHYSKENLAGLEINEEEAAKICENLPPKQKECAELVIESIKTKTFYAKRSTKTRRMFTNLTSLKRDLKKTLTFWGGKPAVADVKSCQPAILYSFYSDKNTKEAQKYKKLIESGKFYEYFVDLLPKLFKNRDKIKAPFYTLWFGHDRDWMSKPWRKTIQALKEAFSGEFPELWLEMERRRSADYRAIALELQSKEADIMFDGVVKWCKDNSLKVLTIHDCIFCRAQDVRIVEQKMKEIFDCSLGLSNNISVTKL